MKPISEVEEQLVRENADLRRLLEQAQSESRGLRRLSQNPLGRKALAIARPMLRALGRNQVDRWPDRNQWGAWSTAGEGDALIARQGVLMPGGRAWLDALSTPPRALAVCHPDWRGVRSTVENLFDHRLYLRDDLSNDRVPGLVEAILASEAAIIVFNGLPRTHGRLIRALKAREPRRRLLAIWLGNFMQLGEPLEWRGLNDLIAWAGEGLISRLGFVKRGMAEVFERRGLPTASILSYVRQISHEASEPMENGPHVGLFAVESIWRKLPHTMLAAASLLPHVTVWATGQDERAGAVARMVGVDFRRLSEHALPHEAMASTLAGMHVNLYVTLSECAPMLPLESLSVGSPCLMGPSAPYFDEDPDLRRQLVVASPDDAAQIADLARSAIDQRMSIIHRYRRFALEYNRRAQAAVDAFLYDH